MNYNHYLTMLFLLFSYQIHMHGITKNKLPIPQLESAEIDWWYPHNKVSPKLHVTLRYFDIGSVWHGFSHLSQEEKRKVRKRYQKIKADLITAKNLLLSNQEFSLLFNHELAKNEHFSLTSLDIISTHPDFYNGYVLDCSEKNPLGLKAKLQKLKKYYDNNKLNHFEIIRTKKGLVNVPKYNWYIVAKLENNIIKFRNKLSLHPLFNQFPLEHTEYLPHITLGKILKIKDLRTFIKTLGQSNVYLSKQPHTLKSFTLKDIALHHPNEHKIYVLLDRARNSNMIFMLVFGWKTNIGKLLKGTVLRISDKSDSWNNNEHKSPMRSSINWEHIRSIGLIY